MKFWLGCLAFSIFAGFTYGVMWRAAPTTKEGVGMLSFGLTLLQCTTLYMLYTAFTAPRKQAMRVMVVTALASLFSMLFMYLGAQQMRNATAGPACSQVQTLSELANRS